MKLKLILFYSNIKSRIFTARDKDKRKYCFIGFHLTKALLAIFFLITPSASVVVHKH